MLGANGPGSAPAALATQSPATPPSLPSVAWHIAEAGQSVGPFAPAQLAQAITAGRVTRETLVWSAGMEAWLAAGQVEGLAPFFAPQPPPIPSA